MKIKLKAWAKPALEIVSIIVDSNGIGRFVDCRSNLGKEDTKIFISIWASKLVTESEKIRLKKHLNLAIVQMLLLRIITMTIFAVKIWLRKAVYIGATAHIPMNLIPEDTNKFWLFMANASTWSLMATECHVSRFQFYLIFHYLLLAFLVSA